LSLPGKTGGCKALREQAPEGSNLPGKTGGSSTRLEQHLAAARPGEVGYSGCSGCKTRRVQGPEGASPGGVGHCGCPPWPQS